MSTSYRREEPGQVPYLWSIIYSLFTYSRLCRPVVFVLPLTECHMVVNINNKFRAFALLSHLSKTLMEKIRMFLSFDFGNSVVHATRYR